MPHPLKDTNDAVAHRKPVAKQETSILGANAFKKIDENRRQLQAGEFNVDELTKQIAMQKAFYESLPIAKSTPEDEICKTLIMHQKMVDFILKLLALAPNEYVSVPSK